MDSSYAIFDMKVHNPKSHQACLDLDLSELFNTLGEELMLCKYPEDRQSTFAYVDSTHLIQLYDAGYFAYLRCVARLPPFSLVIGTTREQHE